MLVVQLIDANGSRVFCRGSPEDLHSLPSTLQHSSLKEIGYFHKTFPKKESLNKGEKVIAKLWYSVFET